MTSVWPSIILRCAQLIFAALIVAALASTVTFARVPPVAFEPPARGDAAAAPRELGPLESFAVIAQRNVFRHKAGRPAAISGTLPQTALELELVGTLVAGEGRRWYSLAIVRDARNEVKAVREGQLFVGGRIRVVSIEPRRIVIENAGVLEVVTLASEQEERKLQSQELQPQGLGAREREPTMSYDTRALESPRAAATPPR